MTQGFSNFRFRVCRLGDERCLGFAFALFEFVVEGMPGGTSY